MDTTWIVIADSGRARVFERGDTRKHRLRETETFINPGGRSDDKALRSDDKGRFSGRGNHVNTAEPAVDPVEHENEIFARDLAHYLDSARNAGRYGHLCLIAPPKFLGLIRGQLHKEVQKMISAELPKDISNLTVAQVEAYLRENIISALAPTAARSHSG
ncbi:MAG TPA: host attachment protein [Janthinobacterium sp.]|nr:host attachment protein [Janthinobacterium sp.]